MHYKRKDRYLHKHWDFLRNADPELLSQVEKEIPRQKRDFLTTLYAYQLKHYDKYGVYIII